MTSGPGAEQPTGGPARPQVFEPGRAADHAEDAEQDEDTIILDRSLGELEGPYRCIASPWTAE
jgi:hypothetical protein